MWVISSTPRPYFIPWKDPVPILQEAGWAPGPVCTGGKSHPHRDSIPGRPARSQSLYRLSYPAHNVIVFTKVKSIRFSRTSTKIHTWPLPISVQFCLHYVHALTAIIVVLASFPLIPRCDHQRRFTPKYTVILAFSAGPHSTVGRLAAGWTTGVRLLWRVKLFLIAAMSSPSLGPTPSWKSGI